ncbi:hypothetical protein K432DRAFT_107826 [Lepidopterella palustris CBS 459.81]|uniref:Chromosome transmission fidelity protein 8 n=1 Tax=Lepidopterella palustris CBS 459.81 TaxID=1314670 RepID=A0A8E2DW36_9PEZI|nr:hypothetical protein K432DRAFT_107826 [Lepidopterella palustris CBS 459.81]
MPSIPLYLPTTNPSTIPASNPLPPLLRTPAGLALLEIQGTIHAPSVPSASNPTSSATLIGNLVFPLYNEGAVEADTKWMKRVYLYVGKHQRLTGEVRKLGKAVGVLGRRRVGEGEGIGGGEGDELEILEVVRYKIVFSTRPEPVGGVGV